MKEPEKEEVKENPAAVATEREEVFFEEDVKDILLEDTKEISIGKKEEKLGDTKEITPRRSNIPIPVRKPREEEPVQPVVQAPVQMPVQAGPYLMKTVKPSGFEQMLSQEYDGQISLVVPNKNSVEKQITGQLNITDIMAEWERMKRENEEKRREDVRKRVQQHTGNMFSEFDEATKTGLLEQLEKAVIEAILKECSSKVPGISSSSSRISSSFFSSSFFSSSLFSSFFFPTFLTISVSFSSVMSSGPISFSADSFKIASITAFSSCSKSPVFVASSGYPGRG